MGSLDAEGGGKHPPLPGPRLVLEHPVPLKAQHPGAPPQQVQAGQPPPGLQHPAPEGAVPGPDLHSRAGEECY